MRAGWLAAFAVAAAAFAGQAGWWGWQGVPQAAPAAPERLACLSYAPFRRGQSPFDGQAIPAAQVEEDMRQLAPYAGCVRPNSMALGIDASARFAGELDMAVLAGAWIGSDPAANEREVEALVEAAREHASVTGVIVGNEVLLRGEMGAAELAGWIDRVAARVEQPVTYADVWEFWVANPRLADHVDFVTVHMLPYWEDEPIAAEQAVDHVMDVLRQVQAALPGKPILIGETGWPSAGRMREGARPGHVEQARFVRGMVAALEAAGVDYNLVEAFDQPWKAALEGAVGARWGVFDAERRPKPVLAGPVALDPDWRRHALLAGLAGLLLAGAAAVHAGRRPRPGTAAALVLAGQAGALLLLEGSLYALRETVAMPGLLATAAGVAASAVVLWRLLVRLADGRPASAAASPAVADLVAAAQAGRIARDHLAAWSRLLLEGGTLVVAAGLLLDPRYRGFPTEVLAPAALCFLLAPALRLAPWPADGFEERAIGAAFLLAAAGILAIEGAANLQAVGFAAVLAAFGLARLAGTRRAASSATSTAAAPTSA